LIRLRYVLLCSVQLLRCQPVQAKACSAV
jgi:hypothetical protein